MRWVLIYLVISAIPVDAALHGNITATSDETGLITISGDVYTGPVNPVPEEYVDIVLVRSVHGTCGDPVMVTSQSWPIAEPMYYTYIEWSEAAPRPNIMYRYEFMVRDTDGVLHYLYYNPWGQAYVSYGDAVVMRGRFGFLELFIECESGCWSSHSGCIYEWNLPPIDEEVMQTWIGTAQVVDVYGEIRFDEMWPNCEILITHIEEHDGDCGPVPNRTLSWGDIKTRYR